ncbi:MAG: hypothetical protein NTV51_05965 [Verrucomicrobia bacterium]|nr:hypothetical protein [Verrucomicrobiota bacterium]
MKIQYLVGWLFVCVLAGLAPAQTVTAPRGVFISSSVPLNELIEGESFTLSIIVTGTAPFTYQWSKDSVPIAGATAATYSRSAAEVADVGAYSVSVANSAGSAVSSGVGLSVRFPQLPIITRTPFSRAVKPGAEVTLDAAASGSGLGYEWRRNDLAIPGATQSKYSFTAGSIVGFSEAYTLLVRNRAGAVLSEPTVITVGEDTAPLITSHPVGQSVWLGTPFYLYCETQAQDRKTETYQWYKDGVAIAGATFSVLNRGSSVATDAGGYSVMVTNRVGSVTSATAKITIVPPRPPLITRHPENWNLRPELFEADLWVSYDQHLQYEPTFQWRRNGVVIPGATKFSYQVSGSRPDAAGSYTVVVTNPAGSVTSEPGIVTVETPPPLISISPGSTLVSYGDGVSLALLISAPDPTIVWRKNGVVIPGATRDSAFLSGITEADAGTYVATVTASGRAPMTSRPMTVGLLDFGVPPSITVQPAAQSRLPSTNYASGFYVFAEGEKPLAYQWRKDGVAIPGATTDSYGPPSTVVASGLYSVVVSNRVGSVTSDSAQLSVISPPASSLPQITAHPTSQVLIFDEQSIDLGVTVAAAEGLTYRWFRDGVAIPEGTAAALNPSVRMFLRLGLGLSLAGRYKVVVSNAAGSVTSREALISVLARVSQPSLSPSAVPSGPLLAGTKVFVAGGGFVPGGDPTDASYQWRKDGVVMPGVTTTGFTIDSFAPGDAGAYTVRAVSSTGVVSSSSLILALQPPASGPPVFSRQPVGGTIFPTSRIILSAGVVGDPVPAYQWRKNGLPVSGATDLNLTVTGSAAAGTYTLVATNALGSTISNPAVVALANPFVPSVTSSISLSAPVVAGTPVRLTGTVSGSLYSYRVQWRKNGVDLPGANAGVLAFASVKAADTGAYTFVAISDFGSLESAPVQLNVSVWSTTGVYFGTFPGGDPFALSVSSEGIGALIGLLESRNMVVIARGFTVQANGSFSTTGGTLSRQAASFYSGAITGSLSSGAVTGNLSSLGLSFTGVAKPAAGSAVAVVGYYAGVAVSSAVGEVHAIAAADGALQLVAVDASGPRAARGSVNASGAFSVSQPQYSYTGSLGVGGSVFSATGQLSGAAPILFRAPAATDGVERLANVSTRSVAGSGSRTLIAGFAVTGTSSKDVLVRAIGPGLRLFGVANPLANPKLSLYKGSVSLVSNDDWSNGTSATKVSGAAARLGAFPLAIGSADAALMVSLSPGSYTAQISGDDGLAGVSLVEVYDASATSGDSQKLVNVSTRAEVGAGSDILIVGVVVSGVAPKKMLVRGIGPALAAFGVSDALTVPRLQLYRGDQLLRENSGWSGGADKALVAAAAAQVGAFALPEGSKDTALLLYLEPGSYTAQISGLNNTTGVALVEVYEVP